MESSGENEKESANSDQKPGSNVHQDEWCHLVIMILCGWIGVREVVASIIFGLMSRNRTVGSYQHTFHQIQVFLSCIRSLINPDHRPDYLHTKRLNPKEKFIVDQPR